MLRDSGNLYEDFTPGSVALLSLSDYVIGLVGFFIAGNVPLFPFVSLTSSAIIIEAPNSSDE